MPNWYVSRERLRDALGYAASDTGDDRLIAQVIESVSRQIDAYCNRHFYPREQVRYFTPGNSSCVFIDDLLSASSVRTDSSGGREYGTTLATTDYELAPANASAEDPGRAYWRLERIASSTASFPLAGRALRIGGRWGYYDQRRESSGTIAAALGATDTAASFSASGLVQTGETLLVDQEQIFVEGLSTSDGKVATLRRGVNGSTPASHAASATFGIYEYPMVSAAALQQAAMDLRAKDAPMGQVGSDVIGSQGFGAQVLLSGGLHPFVRRALWPLRRLQAG